MTSHVSVFSAKGEAVGSAPTPQVFGTALRPDLVRYVFTNMRKNRRQAYALSPNSGYQHSAESWGTGRAMARIPRVSASGTHASSQGAFGNMCRGGGMYAPTKTYRRWHRKINLKEKRLAVAAALAASANAGVVLARGHAVENVPQLPLVVDDEIERLTKTKQAVALLQAVGCTAELARVEKSRQLHSGNRRSRLGSRRFRKGPLVVFSQPCEAAKAFRNIPGVDTCVVSDINLLKLAPGGVGGRLLVYSRAAFTQLDAVYAGKSAFALPAAVMKNKDVAAIINSMEIQAVLLPKKLGGIARVERRNPLRNAKAREALAIKGV